MSGHRDAPRQLRFVCCAERSAELHEFRVAMERRHRDRGSTRKTINTVRKVFSILESLGLRAITELEAEDLDRRFVERNATTGIAVSTQDLLRRHLHSIIRCAHSKGYIQILPKLPKLPKPGGRKWREEHSPTTRHRPPAQAVRLRLEDHLKSRSDRWSGLRLYTLVMIEAETEISLASALRLTPSDIDLIWSQRIRYFPRHGRHQRWAPVSPRLGMVLWMWLDHCGPRWVFPNRSKWAAWSEYSARRALEADCRAAGIERITFEQLRRYDATRDSEETGSGTEALKSGIDFDAEAEALLRNGLSRSSQLVKFMKDRTIATFQDVIDEVFGGECAETTIRVLVNRTNNALQDLKLHLGFSTRGSQVLVHRGLE